MTPHNIAKKGEIAKVVLMAGDPLRVKWIAENFLSNVRLVNNIRNAYCYTGYYKNKLISIMAHGMGIPSIGIYSYELYKYYDVDTIIRIGSTGSYSKNIEINDIVLVDSAFSESSYAKLIGASESNILYPSSEINSLIQNVSFELGKNIKISRCYSTDVFYSNEPYLDIVKRTNSQCVEMEAFGLFANALKLNKKAATLLTCSDSLITNNALSPEERQSSFKNMVILALESAIKLI